MFETNNHCRLNTYDVSFREARMIFEQADPNDENAPQNPDDPSRILEHTEEQTHDGQNAPVNSVDAVRADTKSRVDQVAPIDYSGIGNPGMIMALLEQSGVLNNENDEPPSSPDALEAALTTLSEDELIRAARTVDGQLKHYEERIRRMESNMKRLRKLGCSQSQLAVVVDAVSQYESREGEMPTRIITRENIAQEIGIDIPEISTQDSQNLPQLNNELRSTIYDLVIDMTQTNRHLRSLGQPMGEEELSEIARNDARDHFLSDLNISSNVIRQELDRRINERAGKLLKRANEIWESLNIDTFGTYEWTAENAEEYFMCQIPERIFAIQRIERKDKLRKLRAEVSSDGFLLGAEEALKKLDELEQELRIEDGHELPVQAEALILAEGSNERWAAEMGPRIARISSKSVNAPQVRRQLDELKKLFEPWTDDRVRTANERAAVRLTHPHERRRIQTFVDTLAVNPNVLTDEDLRDGPTTESPDETAQRIKYVQMEVSGELQTLLPDILTKLDHPICDLLNLKDRVRGFAQGIENDIAMAIVGQCKRSDDSIKNIDTIHDAEKKMSSLRNCRDHLDLINKQDPQMIIRIKNQDEFKRKAGRQAFGYYDYKAGKIFINESLTKERGHMIPHIIEHEMGHAIADAFRRFGVFPALYTDLFDKFARHNATGNGEEDIMAILKKRAAAWGIVIADPAGEPTTEEQWMLMDELVNRTAEWRDNGKPEVRDDDMKLFQAVERMNENSLGMDEPIRLEGKAFMTADSDGDDDGTSVRTAPADPDAETAAEPASVDDRMTAIRRMILHTEEFLKAYPTVEGKNMTDYLNEEYSYKDYKEFTKDLEKALMNGLQSTDEFLNNLSKMEEGLKAIQGFYEKVDSAMADLSKVRKTGHRSLWMRITEDVTWVSLSDLGAMFKDMGSDIARMWKRRGEAARNRVGKSLTELIPDDVPYAGRLKHEFERRDRESEEEEVGVWEKGLDKIDSHRLQDEMMPRVTSKEQLKAIINLLTKRGHMNWDDDLGLWKKLQEYSGFAMPIKPCQRSTILRNQWLQKMIGTIYRDKELFDHWQTENAGACEKGRSSFTDYVDSISALKNEGKELAKLLKRHDDIKHGRIKFTAEEDVNPHLYEEIIHYSMRNGKMSMEGKFYYLIKGVDAGILSLDRLRTFPGEKGGVLGQFPFIDYFTKHHNTKHEIRQIAEKITENGIGDDPYSPGPKTTRFLYEDVANDGEVKWRVNKVLKQAQGIDHEDIPMMLSAVDYQGVTNMMSVYSGNQWKVSTQGVENGYVGFNSILQYMGMKAAMGRPPLSERDISKFLSSMGAYTLWDNIATQMAKEGTENRPYISWQQMREDEPVSAPGRKTSEYRDSVGGFLLKLCQKLGITDVRGLGGKNPIDIEDYIGIDRDANSAEKMQKKYKDGWKKTMYECPENFLNQLKSKIRANPDVFSKLLAQHATQGSFLPENGDFTYDKMKDKW